MELWRLETVFRPPRVAKAAIALLAAVSACERDDTVSVDRNRPPETFVTLGPEASDNPEDPEDLFYRAHLFWRGEDADGTVAGFRFAVDDTLDPAAWRFTGRTDSVFRFTVNEVGSREHLFLIRAVDNLGKQDPSPDTLRFEAFTSENPTVRFPPKASKWIAGSFNVFTETCVPPSSAAEDSLSPRDTVDVCSDVTFVWTGSDGDGEIVGWESKFDNEPGWRFHQRNDTTRVERSVSPGNHTLSVRAIDDAGAKSTSIARFPFTSNHDPVTKIDSKSIEACLLRTWTDPDSLLCVRYDSAGVIRDTMPHNSEITVCWSSTDVDGPVVRYQWQIDQYQDQTPDTRPFASTDTCATAGPLPSTDRSGTTLRIKGIDIHDKAEGAPDTLAIHVNYRPRVQFETIPADTVTVPSGRRSNFDFSGFDIDSNPTTISFRWKFSFEGTFSEWIDPPQDSLFVVQEFDATQQGVHLLEIEARDVGDRVSTRDTLYVRVLPPSPAGDETPLEAAEHRATRELTP